MGWVLEAVWEHSLDELLSVLAPGTRAGHLLSGVHLRNLCG